MPINEALKVEKAFIYASEVGGCNIELLSGNVDRLLAVKSHFYGEVSRLIFFFDPAVHYGIFLVETLHEEDEAGVLFEAEFAQLRKILAGLLPHLSFLVFFEIGKAGGRTLPLTHLFLLGGGLLLLLGVLVAEDGVLKSELLMLGGATAEVRLAEQVFGVDDLLLLGLLEDVVDEFAVKLVEGKLQEVVVELLQVVLGHHLLGLTLHPHVVEHKVL